MDFKNDSVCAMLCMLDVGCFIRVLSFFLSSLSVSLVSLSIAGALISTFQHWCHCDVVMQTIMMICYCMVCYFFILMKYIWMVNIECKTHLQPFKYVP